MSCNSCGKNFSYFRKERGCSECGFSFCSKCLLTTHQKESKDVKICAKCKNSQHSKPKVLEPPDAFRRLQASNDYNQEGETKTSRKVQRNEDEILQERLNKLKEPIIPSTSNNTIPTEEELRERLSILKGTPSNNVRQPLILTNHKSDQEQVDDLLKQYIEETNIKANLKKDFDKTIDDMSERVKNLDSGISMSGKKTIDEPEKLECDNNELAKILKMVKAKKDSSESLKLEELPFCEICNEDAEMRCLGCKYLFCRPCFNEHKDDDDGCDKYVIYKPSDNS